MDSIQKSSSHPFLQVNASTANNALMVFDGLHGGDKAIKLDQSNKIIMPLAVLAQSTDYKEHWSDGKDDVEFSKLGGQIKHNQIETAHHLVLCFQCDDQSQSLSELVADVYSSAYETAKQKGFEHLIRVWNYLDRINQIEQGVERYQSFCVARHQVLEELYQLNQPNPAATAIGGHFGHNTFVFLFSHQLGTVIENKRQVSAWQYPSQYAPKQPRFSRAMQYGDLLLCSGTASVVGHKTIHLDNLSSQFDECMINIQALLDESDLSTSLKSGVYRFYVRDKSLIKQVIDKIKALQIRSYVVLEGDVCRENLLIECEAVFQSV